MTQQSTHAGAPVTTQREATQPETAVPITAPTPVTQLATPLTAITVQLTGHDGNAFAVLGRVREALRRGGRSDLIEPFTAEATGGDYDHLLQTCHRYVHCD